MLALQSSLPQQVQVGETVVFCVTMRHLSSSNECLDDVLLPDDLNIRITPILQNMHIRKTLYLSRKHLFYNNDKIKHCIQNGSLYNDIYKYRVHN